mmetsp:Transcript_29352/g.44164  ORF Transcript_29352/g.44164 Transcript_29352/m.44164 type:complete len:138 (-) Transcript_29352:1992-2405(-)
MSQAADATDAKNDIAAAVDDSYDDLCEVEIPFSMIDDGSSDDDNLERNQESNINVSHTEKLNENAALDCFNFSVTAHIKGKFEHNDVKIPSEENKCKDIGKSNVDKEGAIELNPTKPDPEKGWLPAPLPLPSWATSD